MIAPRPVHHGHRRVAAWVNLPDEYSIPPPPPPIAPPTPPEEVSRRAALGEGREPFGGGMSRVRPRSSSSVESMLLLLICTHHEMGRGNINTRLGLGL
jgi:hypothetical protein